MTYKSESSNKPEVNRDPSRFEDGGEERAESTRTRAEKEQPKERKETSDEYYTGMPQSKEKKKDSKIRIHFSRGFGTFVVIAASILFYFFLLRLTNLSNVFVAVFGVLKPIIYGLAIAYLLNPIVKTVERYLNPQLEKRIRNQSTVHKIGRGIGVLASLLVLLVIIVALLNMLIPELYTSIRTMIFTVPNQLNHVLDQINEINKQNSTVSKILATGLTEATDYFQTWLKTDLLSQTNKLMSNLTVGVINIFSELLNFIIGIIVSIYVLFSREVFSGQTKKCIYAIFKPQHANMILHIAQKSNSIFGGFIIGKIIDSIIIGVLCFIGLSLLKMPYVLLVSVVVGVTNVIPFFGPYIGAIPSTILIMLDNPLKGIYFLVFILVLQQVDGNIIGPKILGNSTGLSSFWVVFAILLGGGLFGIPGMILGVPTFAVVYYIVEMLLDYRLEKKNLPLESSYYGELSFVDKEGNFIHQEFGLDSNNPGAASERTADNKIEYMNETNLKREDKEE
ncbi:AI-2E family transporter [Hespellia stercorisuis]|uniref:Predicted PurR-regulated permease PerM n=1 Tax=Hespellia stercorisuis DSM 15480 TaxID=1121950 RepID=A0A1M6SSF4_9FIRM|nr:AI-2E family transporter [Hespellia stercorisuis]SHK47664.1 Predicted PurR-regulated permease PerM [Hespellia stercorisuis DSM 15480]